MFVAFKHVEDENSQETKTKPTTTTLVKLRASTYNNKLTQTATSYSKLFLRTQFSFTKTNLHKPNK